MFGNAIVTREALVPTSGAALPRLEFRGEFLHVWPQTERVSSNQPVTLTRDQDQFTADAMEYDNLEQVLQLRGRVRGVIMP
ncbi:LPS export ABC transporter periplasmic protein LptC, partial [Bacillus sp. SRB_336]